MYQENHSFDNVLGDLCASFTGAPATHAPCDGIDVTKPVPGVKDPTGKPLYLTKSPDVVPAVAHGNPDQDLALQNKWTSVGHCGRPYYNCLTYYAPSQIPALAKLATSYVVADHTYQTHAIPSFGAHLEFAAQTLDGFTGDNPAKVADGSPYGWFCESHRVAFWRPTPTARTQKVAPCIPDATGHIYSGATTPVQYVPTIMDTMDKKGVSYKYYGTGWHQDTREIIWRICSAFTECLNTQKQHDSTVDAEVFDSDVAHNTLPNFSVLLPYSVTKLTSQHNGTSMVSGDNYIGKKVAELMKSPSWPTTAVFILYDDCGCFYDHEVNVPQPGMGLRTPMVIVSPYAKARFTDTHDATAVSSVLAFTEHTFGIPSLTGEDGNAYDYAGSFDFTGRARLSPQFPPSPTPISAAEEKQITKLAPENDDDPT